MATDLKKQNAQPSLLGFLSFAPVYALLMVVVVVGVERTKNTQNARLALGSNEYLRKILLMKTCKRQADI